MTSEQAIKADIETIKARWPKWFGGRPCIRIDASKVLYDDQQKCVYVTMEDVAQAFSETVKDCCS
jgi:hypothetical protein